MSEIQYIQVSKLWIEELSTPAVMEVNYIAPDGVQEDWQYQLYVNGVLGDISENSSQRSFAVHVQEYPQMFTILAVEPAGRTVDLSLELPDAVINPSWVCRFRMSQDTAFEPGDTIEIYHDGGTGGMQEKPALRWQAWPAAVAHTGWGNATLFDSGFGIDGSNAPGMSAPFGIGPMGLGGYELQAVLPLSSSGMHNVRVLARSHNGATSTAQELSFNSSAPPSRPGALTFISHNRYSKIAKFKIN